jgi:hypothetical protein
MTDQPEPARRTASPFDIHFKQPLVEPVEDEPATAGDSATAPPVKASKKRTRTRPRKNT